jgi:sterol desaturase/sphingolipid hydroxylase (fatty acid hydroxylase superfamily)
MIMRSVEEKSGAGRLVALGAIGVLLAAAAVLLVAIWRNGAFELTLFGRHLDLRAVASMAAAYLFSRHLIVPVAFLVDLAFVGWADSSLRKVLVKPTPSILTDVSVYAITVGKVLKILTIVMTFGITVVSTDWLHGLLVRYTGYELTVAGLPLWAQVLCLLGAYTFCDYWSHRVDHSSAWWPLHRFHHAAEDFCVLTTDRRHPADFTGLIVACSTILLGASPMAFVVIEVLVNGHRHLIHSRIDSDFGWIGRYLIQSPRHHRLHHVLDITDGVGNFALCPIWDRLFGTWYDTPQENWAIGVAEPYRHGVWVFTDMWRDYLDFWAALSASIVPRRSAGAVTGSLAGQP